MNRALGILVPCVLAIGLRAPLADAAQSGAQDIPAIQEEGDFYILNFAEAVGPTDDGMTLEEFVKVCQQATFRNFTYTEDTQGQLKSKKVRLFGTKRVPKGEFYSFFQIMMFINDFACVEIGPPHLSVIVIQSLQPTAGRAPVAQKAEYVFPEDIEQYTDQPATLIRTIVHLPNTDVRQLVNALRPLMPNNTVEGILNAGQSDSLIITGFGSNVVSLTKLLYLIDEHSAETEEIVPVFEVIPLEFASASDIADIIDQLLEASRQAVQNARRAQPPAEGATGQLRVRGSSEAKILVDPRTQSLLVMALPEDMPRIKDLVARLDVDIMEPERNYHIYKLENVAAEDVADVLDNFLRDASRVTETGTGAGGRQPGAAPTSGSSRSNEVVVVPDPNTNSLLIATPSKSQYDEIRDMLGQLDRRQDQVLIETALIELTGQSRLDIGTELGGADIPGDDGQGGFGVTNFGLSTFAQNPLDPSTDIKIPSIATGVTAGIIDGGDFNLPVLLSLFESRDDTNVLNVPSVLVNNNGTAIVSTLDEQPTTQITATGAAGTTQENFAGYQEAGITLRISPSISASRYLRLGIELRVSNFVGTFSGAIPPPRITRELSTSVNVPDGDTMVIGGIISDNDRTSRQMVPWLGDIPILGFLFRRDVDSNNRTTLYFFVTPHILHDENFADLADISYRKKLDAADTIGAERVRLVDPTFGTHGEPDLEPFELPLYRSPERGEVEGSQVGLDPVRRNELMRQAAEEEPVENAPTAAEQND